MRRVRVRVDIREAWRLPSGPLVWLTGSPPSPEPEGEVFEATVVAINRGERPVYIEVLGLNALNGNRGFDDRLGRNSSKAAVEVKRLVHRRPTLSWAHRRAWCG